MRQDNYKRLVCGQKCVFCAGLLWILLGSASAVYSAIIKARNILYDRGVLKSHKTGAIVISIGNITVGGTGKTPLVIWLCKEIVSLKFKAKNYGCAILTRGYKTSKNLKLKTQNYLDEPAILAESCPAAKVIVNPDRIAAAKEAVEKFGAKVLVMDDGFQHRRLARDLDIVTIDGTEPFGPTGKMLPAGLQREPVSALKRADAVVITRCDQVSETELAKLEERLRQENPDMIIARSIHNPVCAKSMDEKEMDIEQLKDKRVFAFCGIGNPDAFLNTIRRLNVNLVGWKVYDDHHRYTGRDISDIHGQARNLNADLILSTQKDWTKIISNFKSQISDYQPLIPSAYLAIELKFLTAEDKLKGLIEDTLAGKI